MTDAELNSIEAALGITLPPTYRNAMLEFPISPFAGNSDSYLWDNASRLIEENTLLRNGAPGGGKPWPRHFFCLGRAGGGDCYAIDLRTPDASVWWADHSHIDLAGSGRTHESFNNWLNEFVSDALHDLDDKGLAADCSPDERLSVDDDYDRLFGSCLLWIIGLGLSFLVLVLLLTWFLNSR